MSCRAPEVYHAAYSFTHNPQFGFQTLPQVTRLLLYLKKRRNATANLLPQEMKTPRPSNKLPDQVRDAIRLKRSSIRTACPKACGELVGPYAEGNKPMSIGSNATSSFTTSAVPRIWGAQKSRPSSLTSPWSETSLPLARIRPPALPGMAISKALRLKDAGTVARLPAAVGHRAFTANCAAPEQPISRMWISRVTMHHLLIDQLPISWQLRPHRAETPYSCPDPATLWPKPT